MQYSTSIRKKDKSYQYIITYKVGNDWKTKSKQGFSLNKEGKKNAQEDMDKVVLQLKKQLKNNTDINMVGITFGQFAEKHIEHLKLYKETNTVVSIRTVLNHFISLNDIELSRVSVLDIQLIVDDMTRSKLKSNVIKDYVCKLGSVFAYAKNEYKLIYESPTENVSFKVNKEILETCKRALNKSESDKLLEDFKEGKHEKYYLVLLIALTCGLRLGEILGLTWDDIDTKNSIMKVNKQWKRVNEDDYNFGTLKSKNSYRDIPIPPKTNTILKAITIRNMNGRVFNFKSTGSVSNCLNRIFKIGEYNITVHELRHTYATILISNGVPFKTAAYFLGHTVEQTMKTYSHVNEDMIKKATSIIENIF